MYKLLTLVVLVLLIAVPSLGQDNPIDLVCLITNAEGTIDDGTFNETTYNGLLQAAEDFALEVSVIETVATVDYMPNINTCIDEGNDIIITVGFPMADATLEAAQMNPEVFFIGVDQFIFEGPENLVGLQFREDQMGFAVGAMAALMTETGRIAGVYGQEIPPVIKFRNGYERGARYINPDIEIFGTYLPSFDDPALGGETALTLIGEGADVVFGGGGRTGSGAIAAAAEEGVYVIGVDLDEYFTTFQGGEAPGAENIISSAMKRVDVAVYNMIEALIEGGEDFPGGSVFVSDVTNDGVDFAPPHDSDVPEEVTEQVEGIFEMLRTGELVTGVDPVTGLVLPTIPEVAADAGSFTVLLQAVEAAGLAETLAEGGPFTVFAPTDEAFAAALNSLGLTAEELLADTETLTDILLYHVVENAVRSGAVIALDGESATTLQGGEIAISVTDAGVVLNDEVNVVAVDVAAQNGVIHVIDAVLLPPMEE